MKDVQFSEEMFFSFIDLLKDIQIFWSFNNVHLEQPCTGKGYDIMKEVSEHNTKYFHSVKDIFKQPIKNHYEHNKKMFIKNLNKLIKFIHNYIKYAEPRYKKYRKDIYDERLKDIIEKYEDFNKKYL